jgi:hypothetical protein
MSNYTPIVNYAAKDALITGDPSKKILGTEISAELSAIQTAVTSKEDAGNKNQPNGYAGLDGSSLLPDARIPSNIPRKDAASNTFTGNVSVSGTLQMAGATVWTSANDGTTSGLDADLLDGQHGAYYLPAASYTAADALTKIKTVDGTGSGLDADLLDGQQGSYYQAASGYTAADVLSKLLTVDGTGTGLDADKLDGAEGSTYASLASANFTSLSVGSIEVGYRVIPRLSGAGGTAATTWRGKCYASTAGVTIPNAVFAAGDCFSIYNNTAGALTITRGSGVTLYYNGTNSATVSLPARDIMTVWYDTASTAIIK